MADMLKASKYYSLDCSLVPDNKIKQVSGTYTTTNYSGGMNFTTVAITHYRVDNPLGGWTASDLPVYDPFEQSYHTNEFYVEVSRITEGDQAYFRREKVVSHYTVDVYSDAPLKYDTQDVDNCHVEATDVVGTAYTRTANDRTQGFDGLWLTGSVGGDTNVLTAPEGYNMTGEGDYSQSELSQLDIKSVTVDGVYNGQVLLGTQYLLRLHVDVYIINNEIYSKKQTGIYTHEEGYITQNIITSFKLQVSCSKASQVDNDFIFNYNSDADCADYPLNIKGNMYTNNETIIIDNSLEVNWRNYISSQIMNMFHDGRLWIKAKVKASFLEENGLGVNHEVIIFDLDNKFIGKSQDGGIAPYIFSIKNVEYVYEGNSFIANIVLLEVRVGSPVYYVVNSSNVKVVTSNNIKIVYGGVNDGRHN